MSFIWITSNFYKLCGQISAEPLFEIYQSQPTISDYDVILWARLNSREFHFYVGVAFFLNTPYKQDSIFPKSSIRTKKLKPALKKAFLNIIKRFSIPSRKTFFIMYLKKLTQRKLWVREGFRNT